MIMAAANSSPLRMRRGPMSTWSVDTGGVTVAPDTSAVCRA
jgi:hypothetical protein